MVLNEALPQCSFYKLPVKYNVEVVYVHTRLSVNGVEEDFLEKGDS